MLWFIVQLNRAFGLRGRVHIELAGIDQSRWQTQGKRKSSPWRRRGPLGVQEVNGTVCHGRGDYLRFLYLSKFCIIINGKKNHNYGWGVLWHSDSLLWVVLKDIMTVSMGRRGGRTCLPPPLL